MSSNPIFDIDKPIMNRDDTIDRYDFQEIRSATNDVSSLPRFQLWSSDKEAIYDVANSFIEVRFQIQKTSGGAGTALSDVSAPVASAWELFESARLMFDQTEIANVLYPGTASVMRKVFEGSPAQSKAQGSNHWFYPDECSDGGSTSYIGGVAAATSTNNIGTPIDPIVYDLDGSALVTAVRRNPNYNDALRRRCERSTGKQWMNVFLPLKDVFPVLENMHVLRGVRVDVELVKHQNEARVCFGNVDCTAIIQRISLWMPRVQPSLAELAKLEEKLVSGQHLTHNYYHMELHRQTGYVATSHDNQFRLATTVSRPSHALIAFGLSARQSSQKLNTHQFDLGSSTGYIKTLRFYVNSVQCPEQEIEISNDPLSYRHARAINDLHQLAGKLVPGDRDSSSLIRYEDWVNQYPIFAIDLSKLPPSALQNNATSDLRVQWTLSGDFPGTYDINVLLFSEKQLEQDMKGGRLIYRRA